MTEVLALKYRPQIFEEVIGQDQTVNQLRSALDNGTLGHALLFCGTRGTGKTSTARILARELNQEYPEVCENWENRQHLVLMEIDAASNTGVDNVRDLIEKLQYSTQGHRVVVLDEAHMMSKNAFNALLKTLEEPPPSTTFVLVTTEPSRLPDTVRSRCQIYEFQEVSGKVLAAYYAHIMELEGIEGNPGTPGAVALKANGSVRDGLSFMQTWLSGEAQEDNSKQYFELVGAIYSQDVATALGLVSELRKVEEARTIIQTLERWFYWCSMETFGMKTPVREFFGEGDALDFDLAHLQRLFDSCLEVERNFTATPNAKIVLEMGVMKLCL
jgi:DNA polymerase-3 subunit gamma/tau